MLKNHHQPKQHLVLCLALTVVIIFFTKCNDSIAKSTRPIVKPFETSSSNSSKGMAHRVKSRLRILYDTSEKMKTLFLPTSPKKLILQFVKAKNGELTLFIWTGDRTTDADPTKFNSGRILTLGKKSGIKIKDKRLILSNIEISGTDLDKLYKGLSLYTYICFEPAVEKYSDDLLMVKYILWGSNTPGVIDKTKATQLYVDPNPSPPHQAN